MTFNSLTYLIFLPLVFLVFRIVGARYRWIVLLISSYLFYGFILKPILLITLTAVIIVTYQIGILIDKSEARAVRKRFLWSGIIVNLALLVYFKYIPFIDQNLNIVFKSFGLSIVLEKPLPLVSIGLSFYIFQAISYLADIYFRMAKSEQHFGYFALYLAFFPKLMQGPIERANDLIPQLKTKYEFNFDNLYSGIVLFVWGLFQKVVIADRLGLYVDAVFNDIKSFNGLPLLLAIYAYSFQLYMDFYGYTNMALGSAKIFNINLTQNFNGPYLATSVADFWRRWHISFSRWILDYIFEPLQMQFRNFGKWGTAAALLIAFVLAGIWHGANWTFVAFGFIHGIYLACSFFYRPYQKKMYKTLGINKYKIVTIWQVFITFNLVSFAFVFFRSNNISDAILVLTNITVMLHGKSVSNQLSNYSNEAIVLIISIALLYLIKLLKTKIDAKMIYENIFTNNTILYYCNIILYGIFYYLLCFYGVESKSFVYFNF